MARIGLFPGFTREAMLLLLLLLQWRRPSSGRDALNLARPRALCVSTLLLGFIPVAVDRNIGLGYACGTPVAV